MYLSGSEQSCLEHLLHHPDSDGAVCSTAVLEGLLAQGLVLRHTVQVLPGMAHPWRYRLTDAGQRLLASL